MKTEKQGQSFGARCWRRGLSVNETLDLAAFQCGVLALDTDPAKWPKFVHGAEEAWQDREIAQLDEGSMFAKLVSKHVGAKAA